MPHYRSLDVLSLKNAWLTIGVFDGVHLGHQALLRSLVDGARAASAPAVVMTFDPHPAIVLGGRTDFKCLTTPEERAALLGELGVEAVITQAFDRAFAAQTAEEFMRRVARTLGLRRLLVGHDFALGRGRAGDAACLAELGRTLGYDVEVIEPVRGGGSILSSTAIRAQVAAGAVSEAAASLGRWYAVAGPVIHGDGRGHLINIPTANVAYPPEKLIPANGIYATWAWVGGERYASATNIGINPTFTPDKTTPNVEAYLLDFDRDLYGQEVKLEFAARLRDEMKFPSAEALVAQIRADVERTRAILK
ncbi:MAG: riboflavin kinase / FMN adenylyltransferase [Anaerolineaceae bacterium]|nr:MAG: riboflavin kinase / FMN adenylyltransferase [Anaerolineaceae bacterium]